MDLNGSTACYQHCSNGITMCVQNQWAFLKVEILNGFKWSISRRVKYLNFFLNPSLLVADSSDLQPSPEIKLVKMLTSPLKVPKIN